MSDDSANQNWREAQLKVLVEEFQIATGNGGYSIAEAQNWFTSLPVAERDRVGRRMNDPKIVGWHLQTPKID